MLVQSGLALASALASAAWPWLQLWLPAPFFQVQKRADISTAAQTCKIRPFKVFPHSIKCQMSEKGIGKFKTSENSFEADVLKCRKMSKLTIFDFFCIRLNTDLCLILRTFTRKALGYVFGPLVQSFLLGAFFLNHWPAAKL